MTPRLQSISHGSSVSCFPVKTYTHDWSGKTVRVALFGRPDTYRRILKREGALHFLVSYARVHGIEDIFMPTLTPPTGIVLEPRVFPKNRNVSGVRVWFGALGDGVMLPRRSAFFLATADCPTFVLRSENGLTVAAHAGRDCLLDRRAFLTGSLERLTSSSRAGLPERLTSSSRAGEKRPKESVVTSAIETLGGETRNMHASVFCGIGSKYFAHPIGHPDFGALNAKMIEHVRGRWGRQCFSDPPSHGAPIEGRLNLFELIRSQCMKAGVVSKNIWHDGACTFSDVSARGEHMWWSHRRGDKERNGILVMRID